MRAIALLLVGLTITISSPASAESLLRKLLRVTGISATPSQQKSPGQEMESGGVIWVSDVATKTAHKLSDESGFRSPIFAPNDQAILAVRAGTLWQISLPDGSAKKLHEVASLTKLVGIDQDDSDKVLVLLHHESALVPARLSLASGATTEISYDPKSSDDRKLLTHLKEWERVYGETKVYPQAQRREGIAGLVEWQDVFLKKGDAETVNLSHCEGDNCGQPSLSNNQTTVVFVRAKP